ncbi:MAG: double-strand break repair helicase AddA [Pseudomonadota bacterium]
MSAKSESIKTVQNGSNESSNDPIARQNDSQTHRPLDPNVLQRRASSPESSVWVSASAGTGKTKVLTDRVLRLLLPRESSAPGTKAQHILCLTFTKAAASEMALRISETLRRWAVMEESELEEALKKLLGRSPTKLETLTARRLFADVVDVPGGLKIMTIHAFCQSILGRFPLEAGISPQFSVLEDAQSQALMREAQSLTLSSAQKEQSSTRAEALSNIAATINEEQFLGLLGNMARERHQLEKLVGQNFDPEGLYIRTCEILNAPAAKSKQEILREATMDKAFDVESLKKAQQILSASGKKTDVSAADKMAPFLNAAENERTPLWNIYKGAFITLKNEPRAKLATQDSTKRMDNILDVMSTEAQRIIEIEDTLKAAECAQLTRDLIILGYDILQQYEGLKAQQSALDFDDLILQTLSLLSRPDMGSWVHYKLDQGLNHILIDEAQDTNPEQWQIIEGLCEEFFNTQPDDQETRTVFTVGDEKQSIYSFQRASPEEFARMKNDFRAKIQRARQSWDEVPMNISFRSTQSVLKAVDAVFASEAALKGLGQLPVEHSSFRRGQAGLVELWPVFENDPPEEFDLWTPLRESQETQSAHKKLSLHIAQTVKDWIANKESLESQDRPVRAGDIMILVRTRSALVNQIARELKNLNIPVSGLDRMFLNDELAVQDLLAAAEFTLQPLDDLNLACLLKSPLVGLDEDTLFQLCVERGNESLWSRIQSSDHQSLKDYLTALLQKARSLSPFAFFAHILQSPCPGDDISARRAIMGRLGADAMDPLDELLNLAREFENNHPASLQSFIQHQRMQDTEIKREQSATADEVRIMTIHGAKGLQAPIVILPDTLSSAAGSPGKSENRLIWPKQTGRDAPLWSPRKDMDCRAYQDAMEIVNARTEEEYRRLLYVAMTRAEDRLYVCGALNRKQKADKLPEGCWYQLIQSGLDSLEETQSLETQSLEGDILRLSNPQTKDADKKPSADKDDKKQIDAPDWLRIPAPQESQESKIFRPSQIADSHLSPLKSANNKRFLRGNLTHKLLQLLPDIPQDRREHTALSYLKRYAKDLSDDIIKDISQETLNVLNMPEFEPLFAQGSSAEVPISGFVEGKGLVSGQIDRLRVTEGNIWIIDYKTNRPPPTDANAIPEIYKTQMRTYAQVLGQIYPGRTIHAALLWTDGPLLMPLDLGAI